MADHADIADELQQQHLELALAKIKSQQPPLLSRHFCVDCDEVIPEERQRLGGKIRCLSCQIDHEQRNRTQIQRPLP